MCECGFLHPHFSCFFFTFFFCLVCLIPTCLLFFYLILFHSCFLDVHLFSNERQKGCRFRWEGSGNTLGGVGGESYQNILDKINLFSMKEKQKKKVSQALPSIAISFYFYFKLHLTDLCVCVCVCGYASYGTHGSQRTACLSWSFLLLVSPRDQT